MAANARKFIPTEEQEQMALFQWRDLAVKRWPELSLMHAIPNGGKRDKATAARLKAQGVKAGVLDVFLPVSRGAYHGLYVEMKRRERAKVSEAQHTFMNDVRRQGYSCVVCYGVEKAIEAINRYMNQPIWPIHIQLEPQIPSVAGCTAEVSEREKTPC